MRGVCYNAHLVIVRILQLGKTSHVRVDPQGILNIPLHRTVVYSVQRCGIARKGYDYVGGMAPLTPAQERQFTPFGMNTEAG